jgi:hypothetical protein
MFEILPIAAGIVLAAGLLRWGPRSTQTRWAVAAVCAVVVGIAVSAASGELAESWAFALMDTALALAAFAVTTVALRQVGWASSESRRTI